MFKNYMLLVLVLLGMSCNSQKPSKEDQETIKQAKENFVFVEGGTFIMGVEGHLSMRPHQVTLDAYSMSKYETTFKEYDVFCKLTGRDLVKPHLRDTEDIVPGYEPNFGVKYINWYDARAYCNWLGEQLNLPIDLPTEAQWEYAARSRGLDVQHATNNGRIDGNLKDENINYRVTKVPVGSSPPNPLGLYDMSGGRPEWTRDWLKTYPAEPLTNPYNDTIPKYFTGKSVRGFHTLVNSVYIRTPRKPDDNKDHIGFRCVCNQKTLIN